MEMEKLECASYVDEDGGSVDKRCAREPDRFVNTFDDEWEPMCGPCGTNPNAEWSRRSYAIIVKKEVG